MTRPAGTTIPTGVAGQLGLDANGAPLARHRRWWILAAVSGAPIAGLAILLLRGGPAPAQFQTEPVRRGPLTVIVSATGILHPTNQIDVGSELSGIVRSVEATYNQRVVKGQVLARIDSTRLEAQASQLRAALAVSHAKVALAKATVEENRLKLERLEQVRERSGGKVPAHVELDTTVAALARARADLASAEAAVIQARAALQATLVDTKKAVVRSPVNGVVLIRAIEPGQTVAATLQSPVLFTVAEDLRRMELRVDVDEADVGRVKVGQDARFTVDAFADRSFSGKVAQVRLGATTTSGVVTYTTVLAVDNDDLALFPGMTATAQIVVERNDDALLVPAAALRYSPPKAAPQERSGSLVSKLIPLPPGASPKEDSGAAGSRVYVLRDGALTAVPVTTGASDGQYARIISGELAIGSELVVGESGGKR